MGRGGFEDVANCVTCGVELHPERAKRYSYCTSESCQAENRRGLTIVAVGVNKASDQYVLLDERAAEEMASGRYRDAGRTSLGRLGHDRSRAAGSAAQTRDPDLQPDRARPSSESEETWTQDEQNLALAYEITGRLPLEEIAKRLGRETRTVARMLAAAKARWSTRDTA
jgi:hypothetical protein